MNKHARIEIHKIKANHQKDHLALKLQAYERMSLFCERIDIPALVLRLDNAKLTPQNLKNSLLIAIHKEFEHNLSQQIYVSGSLWSMIELLKDNTIEIITASYAQHGEDIKLLKEDLFNKSPQMRPFKQKVLEAIRKEVEVITS